MQYLVAYLFILFIPLHLHVGENPFNSLLCTNREDHPCICRWVRALCFYNDGRRWEWKSNNLSYQPGSHICLPQFAQPFLEPRRERGRGGTTLLVIFSPWLCDWLICNMRSWILLSWAVVYIYIYLYMYVCMWQQISILEFVFSWLRLNRSECRTYQEEMLEYMTTSSFGPIKKTSSFGI